MTVTSPRVRATMRLVADPELEVITDRYFNGLRPLTHIRKRTTPTIDANEADGGESPGAATGYPGLGGGIEGAVTLINSTVSGNTARGGLSPSGPGGRAAGGGIDATTSAVTLTNSTISGNRAVGGRGASAGTGAGGGIVLSDGSATVTNTILAGNRADSGPNCLGTVTSGGHNLLGKKAGCGGFSGPGDQRGADPMLGPLQDDGGPTFTMALMPGSKAIASGDDSICAAPPVTGVDQRDFPRQDDPHCDIGAYEVQP